VSGGCSGKTPLGALSVGQVSVHGPPGSDVTPVQEGFMVDSELPEALNIVIRQLGSVGDELGKPLEGVDDSVASRRVSKLEVFELHIRSEIFVTFEHFGCAAAVATRSCSRESSLPSHE
jgi:hypothetical protein